MENELYLAIQSLITLIERTDFTRQISVNLDIGNSMLGFVLIVALLSLLLGFMIGSVYQEKKDFEQFKTDKLMQKYEVIVKEDEQ